MRIAYLTCISCLFLPISLLYRQLHCHVVIKMDVFIKMKATSHHALGAKDDIFFKHQPLDLSKPTIRLVHLLPLPSPNGHIQCSISHATIGSTYTCPSYCWGDPNPHVSLKSTVKLSPSATIFSTSLLPHVEQLPAMTLLQRGHTGLMHCVSISRTYPSGITRFVKWGRSTLRQYKCTFSSALRYRTLLCQDQGS